MHRQLGHTAKNLGLVGDDFGYQVEQRHDTMKDTFGAIYHDKLLIIVKMSLLQTTSDILRQAAVNLYVTISRLFRLTGRCPYGGELY